MYTPSGKKSLAQFRKDGRVKYAKTYLRISGPGDPLVFSWSITARRTVSFFKLRTTREHHFESLYTLNLLYTYIYTRLVYLHSLATSVTYPTRRFCTFSRRNVRKKIPPRRTYRFPSFSRAYSDIKRTSKHYENTIALFPPRFICFYQRRLGSLFSIVFLEGNFLSRHFSLYLNYAIDTLVNWNSLCVNETRISDTHKLKFHDQSCWQLTIALNRWTNCDKSTENWAFLSMRFDVGGSRFSFFFH